MKDTGLGMRKFPKVKLTFQTDYNRPFLVLYEDVKIAIGELKTRHPIFVMEYRNHDLVFGQHFLNNKKF